LPRSVACRIGLLRLGGLRLLCNRGLDIGDCPEPRFLFGIGVCRLG
jgi:hypothetical protein